MPKKFSKRNWKRMRRIKRMWEHRKQNSPATGVRTSLEQRNRQVLNKLSSELDLQSVKDEQPPHPDERG